MFKIHPLHSYIKNEFDGFHNKNFDVIESLFDEYNYDVVIDKYEDVPFMDVLSIGEKNILRNVYKQFLGMTVGNGIEYRGYDDVGHKIYLKIF